jgi:hypothetical protein
MPRRSLHLDLPKRKTAITDMGDGSSWSHSAVSRSLDLRGCGRGIDRNPHTVSALTLELDYAGDLGKQRPVAANPHVLTRVKLGPNLTNQNAARADFFATKALHTAHLGIGVATVASRALPFFVCHDASSLSIVAARKPTSDG